MVNPRKLEHRFRRISARIPYTLHEGHEANDVPTFWLLLYVGGCQNHGPFLGTLNNRLIGAVL